MIYHITYKNNRKFATPVKNREDFVALRSSKENLECLAKARAGDSEAKGRVVDSLERYYFFVWLHWGLVAAHVVSSLIVACGI